MATTDAIGFGFVPGEMARYFLVTIPRGEEGEVTLAGPFDAPGDGKCPDTPLEVSDETPPLAALSLERWLCIENRVRVEFNRRLRRLKQPAGIWKYGANLLTVPFGNELALLFWAIEEAEADLIANALLNWAWLTPEERAQLYEIVSALSGSFDPPQESPWRRAIRSALVETQAEHRPLRPKPTVKITVPAPGPIAEPARTRKKRRDLDSLLAQPTLPCMDEMDEG